MGRCNDDIRSLMAEAGVYQWQIADRIKMSESNFYRVMRHELKPELKEQVIEAIKDLAVQKG